MRHLTDDELLLRGHIWPYVKGQSVKLVLYRSGKREVKITLPQWLLAISYAFLGWSIGLGFTQLVVIQNSYAAATITVAFPLRYSLSIQITNSSASATGSSAIR